MAYKNVNVDISITPISSYNDLNNKPSINGVELDGNLSSEELGIKADTTELEVSVSTIKSDLDDLGDQVSVIESKIPAEASDSNQLTDKLYLHNNFYTKTQVDQTVELKVNRNELNDYATNTALTQGLDAKQDKGDYALKSELPTKVSELENDSKFISSVPTSTLTSLGLVRPDGTTITITDDGIISVEKTNIVSKEQYEAKVEELEQTISQLQQTLVTLQEQVNNANSKIDKLQGNIDIVEDQMLFSDGVTIEDL